MPLLALPYQPPPPPPPPVVVPSLYAEWRAPDGTVLPLHQPDPAAGWLTTRGIAGWGAVPRSRVDDPSPRGGVAVRHVRAEPRLLTWPLHLYSEESPDEYAQIMRRITGLFTQTAELGAGVLRVRHPDGVTREIEAVYEDGLGGDAGQGWMSSTPVLTLFCPDGFWRDIAPQVVRREYQVTYDFLEDDFPQVTSGQVLGSSTIFNPGDTDAWPDWTITGPATAITATNQRTGEAFTLTHTLEATEQIRITTHPPTVVGPDDSDITDDLDWPGAVLWPLKRGTNPVTFAVTGSDLGTSIALAYTARYETW